MILDAIIGLVHVVLAPIFSLLPTGSLASWFPTSSIVDAIASRSYIANVFLPLRETVDLYATFAEFVIPAVLAYKLANWIYRHIPQLGGFGPGSG